MADTQADRANATNTSGRAGCPIMVRPNGHAHMLTGEQIGGSRVSHDRRAVTVGNEAPIWHSPKPSATTALATCRLKSACSCSSAAGDTFAHPCSSVCSRDAMDRGSSARRRETGDEQATA